MGTHAPTNAPSTSAPTTHPCDNGSHGCDSGPGGVCISKKKGAKDLLFGNTTWKCGCKPSYVCTSGCSVDHKGHKCTLTKAPTNLPTGTPTASPSAPRLAEPTKAPTLVNLRYPAGNNNGSQLGQIGYLQSLRAEQKRCPGQALRCPTSSAAPIEPKKAATHGVLYYLRSLRVEQTRCPGKKLRCPSKLLSGSDASHFQTNNRNAQ